MYDTDNYFVFHSNNFFSLLILPIMWLRLGSTVYTRIGFGFVRVFLSNIAHVSILNLATVVLDSFNWSD